MSVKVAESVFLEVELFNISLNRQLGNSSKDDMS